MVLYRVKIVGTSGSAEEPYKFDFSLEYGDGDGTVNAESLGLCKKWSEEQKGEVLWFPRIVVQLIIVLFFL